MDNNENKNQETELEEVKTEEAVETAEKAVDNADDVEEAQIEKEPVLSFEYDVKNEEEERAFLAFQKKFVYAHNWKITAAFGVVAVLFIVSDRIGTDGDSGQNGYIATQPDVIAQRDGLAQLHPAVALLRQDGMDGCVHAAAGHKRLC